MINQLRYKIYLIFALHGICIISFGQGVFFKYYSTNKQSFISDIIQVDNKYYYSGSSAQELLFYTENLWNHSHLYANQLKGKVWTGILDNNGNSMLNRYDSIGANSKNIGADITFFKNSLYRVQYVYEDTNSDGWAIITKFNKNLQIQQQLIRPNWNYLEARLELDPPNNKIYANTGSDWNTQGICKLDTNLNPLDSVSWNIWDDGYAIFNLKKNGESKFKAIAQDLIGDFGPLIINYNVQLDTLNKRKHNGQSCSTPFANGCQIHPNYQLYNYFDRFYFAGDAHFYDDSVANFNRSQNGLGFFAINNNDDIKWYKKFGKNDTLDIQPRINQSDCRYANAIYVGGISTKSIVSLTYSVDENKTYTPNQICLARLDTSGYVYWHKFYQMPGGATVFSIRATSDTGVIVCGALTRTGVHTPQNNGCDAFVLKLGPDGSLGNLTISDGMLLTSSEKSSQLLNNFQVWIAPNPVTKNNFVVEGNINLPGKVEISDINGKILKQITLTESSQAIDITELQGAAYNCRIWDAQGMFRNQKLVILK